LYVVVDGLKSLAAANDFGPVDLSKPFQPFGASPTKGSSFVLGSKEIFQKSIYFLDATLMWLSDPKPYGGSTPEISTEFLHDGQWTSTTNAPIRIVPKNPGQPTDLFLSGNLDLPVQDKADFSVDEPYSTAARHGSPTA